jgi:hypothetical protein
MVEVTTTDKAINLRLHRHKHGVLVKIRVVPEIEDFFRQWGGGAKTYVTHGRLWRPLDPTKEALTFWAFEQQLSQQGMQYDIYSLGATLESHGLQNISFLRLIGASEPNGREFVVEMPISTQEMYELADRLIKMTERFYLEYIRPVSLNAFVGIMDVSRIVRPSVGDTGGISG